MRPWRLRWLILLSVYRSRVSLISSMRVSRKVRRSTLTSAMANDTTSWYTLWKWCRKDWLNVQKIAWLNSSLKQQISALYKLSGNYITAAKASTFGSDIVVTLFSWLVRMIFVSLYRPCKGNECLTKFLKKWNWNEQKNGPSKRGTRPCWWGLPDNTVAPKTRRLPNHDRYRRARRGLPDAF